LDAQHYLVRFVFKGNYNVPLDPEANLKILDVATGTGVWALEMAHEFPRAQVYGVDISAIFPATIKPSNCHFQLCNILDGLPFPDNYFDFIYQRLLVYALTPAQRKQVNAEVCVSPVSPMLVLYNIQKKTWDLKMGTRYEMQ
jgi:ubiquinone/menaquinone biosynthesis C-methylase UbiE